MQPSGSGSRTGGGGSGNSSGSLRGPGSSRSRCGRLFVGNLPQNVTAVELQQLFAAAGEVKWADIAKDERTGRCKGFGFVQMRSPDATRRALVTLNGRAVHGRFLTVTESRGKGAPPPPKPGPAHPSPGLGGRARLSPRRGYRASR